MARNSFQLEILTPEGTVFDDQVEMVSTRTAVGSIGVMANHTPLLSMLDPCELRLHTADGVQRYAQGEGYMQVGDNRAMILVEDAIPAGEIDTAALQQELERWKSDLAAAEADSEAARVATKNVRRIETFLSVAAGD